MKNILLCLLAGCLLLCSACAFWQTAPAESAEYTAEPVPTEQPAPTVTPTPIPTAALDMEAVSKSDPAESISEEETTPVELTPMQQTIGATQTALLTSQIVLVVDHDLTFWERDESDVWQQRMEAYCGYGSNGMRAADERTEGDNTTPIGSFPLLFAFGTTGNPGTQMTYRTVTANSYWSAENDSTYNTWVESETSIRGEHLIDYYQYKYCAAIGFNSDPAEYGRGSAIFLHCKSVDHWSTAGCVSLEESDLLSLLLMLRDGAYIIIVPDTDSISLY